MEEVFVAFEFIAEIINIIGVSILVFGFVKEVIKYFFVEFKNGIAETPIVPIQKIRCQIGIYILLALDFLIISDIIMSIVELNFDELIILASTIGLRIAMGYFLGKEIEEIHGEVS